MKYKFVSKEQARNDWENGLVQIWHNQKLRTDKFLALIRLTHNGKISGISNDVYKIGEEIMICCELYTVTKIN